tara:strand:+ start:42 stop:605 length:564 start_codon:yes stop_codon:yes gene_type:complete
MDDLRGEVQKILAGRTDGGGSVDPFNERNVWEDNKRTGNAPKAQQVAEQPDKPKSRRAQQAQAREAAKPADPKAESEKAAKASDRATQNRRPQPVNVPAEAAWKPKPNAGKAIVAIVGTAMVGTAMVGTAIGRVLGREQGRYGLGAACSKCRLGGATACCPGHLGRTASGRGLATRSRGAPQPLRSQ